MAFELFCRYWNPQPGGRSYLYAAHRHVDPRPIGTRRLMMLTPDYLPTNQSEKCPRADHSLLLEHYKTHYRLQGGTHSSEGNSLLWSPLPESNKAVLFYFTQNSVSAFLVASVNRGRVSATLVWTWREMMPRDFPGGGEVKNPPASAGDTGSSPGPGRSHMPRSV